MTNELAKWVIATACAAIAVVLMCLTFGKVSPFPMDLAKNVYYKLTGILIVLVAIHGGMLWLDWGTPGEWLEGIAENDQKALVMAAVVVALAIAFFSS